MGLLCPRFGELRDRRRGNGSSPALNVTSCGVGWTPCLQRCYGKLCVCAGVCQLHHHPYERHKHPGDKPGYAIMATSCCQEMLQHKPHCVLQIFLSSSSGWLPLWRLMARKAKHEKDTVSPIHLLLAISLQEGFAGHRVPPVLHAAPVARQDGAQAVAGHAGKALRARLLDVGCHVCRRGMVEVDHLSLQQVMRGMSRPWGTCIASLVA